LTACMRGRRVTDRCLTTADLVARIEFVGGGPAMRPGSDCPRHAPAQRALAVVMYAIGVLLSFWVQKQGRSVMHHSAAAGEFAHTAASRCRRQRRTASGCLAATGQVQVCERISMAEEQRGRRSTRGEGAQVGREKGRDGGKGGARLRPRAPGPRQRGGKENREGRVGRAAQRSMHARRGTPPSPKGNNARGAERRASGAAASTDGPSEQQHKTKQKVGIENGKGNPLITDPDEYWFAEDVDGPR
jgi:hypothetical protein